MVEVNENNSIFEVLDIIPSLFKDDLNILIKENKMFHDLLHDLLLYHAQCVKDNIAFIRKEQKDTYEYLQLVFSQIPEINIEMEMIFIYLKRAVYLRYRPNGEETFSKKLTNEQIDKLNDFVYQYNLDKDGDDLTVDIEFLK